MRTTAYLIIVFKERYTTSFHSPTLICLYGIHSKGRITNKRFLHLTFCSSKTFGIGIKVLLQQLPLDSWLCLTASICIVQDVLWTTGLVEGFVYILIIFSMRITLVLWVAKNKWIGRSTEELSWCYDSMVISI